MELSEILELLQKYDILTLIGGIGVYLLLQNKIKVVDNAVNNRPKGQMTLSQEVTLINSKIDLFHDDLKSTKKDVSTIKSEVDAHRQLDEATFRQLAIDISKIAKKIK